MPALLSSLALLLLSDIRVLLLSLPLLPDILVLPISPVPLHLSDIPVLPPSLTPPLLSEMPLLLLSQLQLPASHLHFVL